MAIPRLFSIPITLALFGVVSANAQDSTKYVQLKTNGAYSHVQIVPGETKVKEAVFWFTSRGNITVPFDFALAGPTGAKIAIKATVLKRAIKDTLNTSKGWWNVPLSTKKLVIKNTSQEHYAAAQESGCPGVSEETIQQIIAIYQLMGQSLTPEEVCQTFFHGGNPGTPTPEPTPGGGGGYTPGGSGGTISERGLLQKDTCGTNGNTRYLMTVRVDLSGVDAATYQEGFLVQAAVLMRPWKGDMAASIKPKSDGHYSPNPLLLMAAVGGLFYTGEWANVMVWNHGKGKLIAKLPGDNYISYIGHLLVIMLPGKVLKGGRATFEMTNGYAAYSVCFSLVRQRQKANGYP